jgi:hypothetical protein
MFFLNRDRLPWGQLELIDCQKNVVFTNIENGVLSFGYSFVTGKSITIILPNCI